MKYREIKESGRHQGFREPKGFSSVPEGKARIANPRQNRVDAAMRGEISLDRMEVEVVPWSNEEASVASGSRIMQKVWKWAAMKLQWPSGQDPPQ